VSEGGGERREKEGGGEGFGTYGRELDLDGNCEREGGGGGKRSTQRGRYTTFAWRSQRHGTLIKLREEGVRAWVA
jgi:hypothetical protein